MQIERKDILFLCCMLDCVGNVCEQFFLKMKKIPVDVLRSILTFVLNS